MKKHLLLAASLYFLLILSCKKDGLDAPKDARSAEIELALKNLKSVEERNFFDKSYILRTNPNIIEALQERGETEDMADAVFNFLLLKNQEEDFLEDWIAHFGYPIWTQSFVTPDTANPNYKVVATPFSKANSNSVTGFMLSYPKGWTNLASVSTNWYILLIDREDLKNHALNNYPDTLGYGYKINLAIKFDNDLFGTQDEQLIEWVRQHPPADLGGFIGPSVSERYSWVTIAGCFPTIPYVFTENEVTERGCGEGWSYYTFSTATPCDDNWSSGGGGSTGGGGGGGGGGGNGAIQPTDEQIVNEYENETCQYYQSVEDGDITQGQVPGGFNQSQANLCNALQQLQFLSVAHQAWLITHPEAFGPIATWLLNNAPLSAYQSQMLSTYISMLASGQTTLAWGQFMHLYHTVVNVLQPQLGLTQGEVNWLLSTPVAGLANQIKSFLIAHSNNELAEEYANFIIDETSNQAVWGNINVVSLNLFEDYDNNLAYLESETQQVTEIQNGIGILETYLPDDPQTPNGTPFGGSDVNPNGGPDLIAHTNRDYTIFEPINQGPAIMPIPGQELKMKALFFMATFPNGSGQTVAEDYLQQFHENPSVFNSYNPILSTMTMNSTKMRNWLKDYGFELNDRLAFNSGNINNVVEVVIPRVALNENNSFTILINDTQETKVYRLDSYTFDPQTGKWDCYFLVNVVDHFGLDDDDAVDTQYLPGFVAWWALQHRRGWWPFRTDIWFVAHLSGDIN